MAFTPTLSDIPKSYRAPSKGGFVPTLADIPKGYAQQGEEKPKGVGRKSMDAIESFGKAALQDILNVGGGLAHGGLKGIADIENIPHALMGRIPAVTAPQAPFADPSSALFQAPEMAAEFAPAALGGEALAAKAIPEAASLLPQIGRGAIIGGTAGFGGTPGDIGQRAQAGAIGAAIAPAVGGAAAGANVARRLFTEGTPNERGAVNAILNMANPKIMDKTASNFYNELSDGLDKTALNSKNAGNIVKSSNAQKKIGKDLYDNLLNQAHDSGYGADVRIKIKDGKFAPTSKFIQLSPKTGANISGIQNAAKDKTLQDSPQVILNSISDFKRTPSLDNAHKLQSTLGKEWASLNSLGQPDDIQRATKNLYQTSRRNVLDDIDKTFANNGDPHLQEALSNARAHWRDNVIPYQSAPQIKRLVTKGIHPKNLINTLSSDDEKGWFDTIRNHLSENPEAKRNILAQALSNKIEGEAGAKTSNIQNLGEAYNKLPDVVKLMTSSGDRESLSNLLQKDKLYKTGRKYLALGGGALGINELRRRLGISFGEVF